MGYSGRLIAAIVVATLTLGAGAAASSGTAPTREEYVSGLEKICKPGSKETEIVMKGIRDDVHKHRMGVAIHKFTRATAIFSHTIHTIARSPRPTADRAVLSRWFVYLGRQEKFLHEITDQLRAGDTIKAQRLVTRFVHNGNLANNEVLDFGFNYCSFKFARFGF